VVTSQNHSAKRRCEGLQALMDCEGIRQKLLAIKSYVIA
jgi:hypothetical protein